MADQQHTSEQNAPQIFAFDDKMVRTVERDGVAWFVATDVCNALEIGNTPQALSRLDDDEKMTITTNDSHSGKRGGARSLNTINESGLYNLIFTSRKEEAKRFKKWVTSEVLPTIRKTGRYEHDTKPAAQPNLVSLQQQSLKLLTAIKAEGNKDTRRYLYAQLEAVSEKLGLQPPALDQIGRDEPDIPPEVDRFWHVYRELRKLGHDLNHHTDDHLVAINLKAFQRVTIDNGLRLPSLPTLHKALRLSLRPKFVKANHPVHSALERKSVKAWIFELEQPGQEV